MERISKSLKIGIRSDLAYQKFVNEFSEWWPKEYTWSQDKLEEIKIDERKNGLCTEIGSNGFRCDIHLVLDKQIVWYNHFNIKYFHEFILYFTSTT
ncbi:hypothetical protein SAMN04488552_0696 [Christiangramia echinicola]|uniref:Activator of Hsp90 ATPase homolog 1-like protein n=1 Tax=Christiangramia echinicola TaxID=279359 RepID=A0A1H1LC59_9FLAO|nr:hypothetical protein [Christiangramia echinicola]SDR72017.1 hypothetical protein SAMN04488552_0696 [Christiangramia echinicola]